MRSTNGARWAGAWLACVLIGWASLAPIARGQESPHDAEAHAYFEAGRMAFGDGRFDEALEAFQRAYDLSGRSQLLYNIGQCHDRMRHDREALTAFQQFLAAEPDSPQAGEVRGRVAFLERAVETEAAPSSPDTAAPTETAESTPQPAPAEPPAPAASPASSDPGPVPWVLVGVGGALAIAGAILVGLGFSDVSTVENAPDGARYATVRDADQLATPFIGAGFAGIGVGAVLAAVGIVLATTGSSGSEHASLRIGPGTLELRGAF